MICFSEGIEFDLIEQLPNDNWKIEIKKSRSEKYRIGDMWEFTVQDGLIKKII